jgi:hypothetical protein
MRIKGLLMNWRTFGAFLLAGLLYGTVALAQAPANPDVIVAADIGGTVRVRIGTSAPQPVIKGQTIPVGARLTTGADSYVVLRFPDGQVLALGPTSRLLIRQFRYLPNDLGKSAVLLNLTDGAVNMVMGAIGRLDPNLVQVQVGTRTDGQEAVRSRGNDVGVIVFGVATMVNIAQGKVSLMVASSGQSYPLATGERALVQADGFVQMGGPAQIGEQAGRTAEGKSMLGQMEGLRRYAPPGSGGQTAFALSTPPSRDALEDLRAQPVVLVPPPPEPVTGVIPTAGTGAGGGGLPCTASCN